MLPAGVLLLLFLTYPLGLGTWLGFTDAKVGRAGQWIGLENFTVPGRRQRRAPLPFQHALLHGGGERGKFALGLWLALLLNRHLPFKSFFRAVVLLPFIVPTALSAIAFWWIYDAQFSVVSWALQQHGADPPVHRFPGRSVERAALDHRGQHLARRAVRGDLPARGPADHLALALRGRGARRRQRPGSASAT